jgi:hypothetical protein
MAPGKRKADADEGPKEVVEIAGVPEPKDPKRRKEDLIGIQPGQHAVISGATGTGKTWWCVDMLLGTGKHTAHPAPFDAVIVMCDKISMGQPAYDRLEKKFKGSGGVRFIVGFPADHDDFIEKLKEYKNNKWNTVVIIDDLMVKARYGPDSKLVDTLFTSGRHLGCAIWQLTQNHTDSRTRRLQCGYLITFRTPADKASLAWIAKSLRPETNGKDVLEAYNIATGKPNGCLIMALNQPNEFMFRDTQMDVGFDMEALMKVFNERNGTAKCACRGHT